MSLNFDIPDNVLFALDTLIKNGHKAYLVGGCVRNALMGIPPHDYDLTTSALPQQVKMAFQDHHVIDTGLEHGTVTVRIDGENLEITTMRTEGEYSDSRHPDNVSFTDDIELDLQRRDFTVNAVACTRDGKLVDPFGGEEDIKKKLLRTVGDADLRFHEDALRILRGIRFISKYGLSPDIDTKAAIIRNKNLLGKISPERIRSELVQILTGGAAGDTVLKYHEVLAQIVPEIELTYGFRQNNPYHKYDVLTHICRSIDSIPPEEELRLCMFFHDMGKPFCLSEDSDGTRHFKGHAQVSVKIAERVMNELKFSTNMRETVLLLVKHHDSPITCDEKAVRRALNKFGYENFLRLCHIHIADDSTKTEKARARIPTYHKAMEAAHEIISKDKCFSRKQLAVNGDDLLQLGITGKRVGTVLELLLSAVIENKVPNEKAALLEYTNGFLE